MTHLTSTGKCTSGDVLSWSEATWVLKGPVETVKINTLCDQPYYHHHYLMAKTYDTFLDCASTCPRFQAGGRIPLTRNVSESVALAKQFKAMAYDYKFDNAIWGPLIF